MHENCFPGELLLLGKRIVRSALLGLIIAVFLMLVIAYSTIGNGEDWSLISEPQFQAMYPEHDYASDYFVPSIWKLVKQAAIWGGIIGAVLSLLKWALSSDS
ncbi:hypothetical protein SuNHUV7_26110 (plasmid) [Pseudoseohaeicola sp. NH-UV-7]